MIHSQRGFIADKPGEQSHLTDLPLGSARSQEECRAHLEQSQSRGTGGHRSAPSTELGTLALCTMSMMQTQTQRARFGAKSVAALRASEQNLPALPRQRSSHEPSGAAGAFLRPAATKDFSSPPPRPRTWKASEACAGAVGATRRQSGRPKESTAPRSGGERPILVKTTKSGSWSPAGEGAPGASGCHRGVTAWRRVHVVGLPGTPWGRDTVMGAEGSQGTLGCPTPQFHHHLDGYQRVPGHPWVPHNCRDGC